MLTNKMCKHESTDLIWNSAMGAVCVAGALLVSMDAAEWMSCGAVSQAAWLASEGDGRGVAVMLQILNMLFYHHLKAVYCRLLSGIR